MKRYVKKSLWAFLILVLCVGGYFRQPVLIEFAGKTMGTTYSVKVFIPRYVNKKKLDTAIGDELVRLNKVFSTYDPESEISFVNGASFSMGSVSDEFLKVFSLGLRVHELTRGAFDPTVGPFVRLWGFGPGYDGKSVDVARIEDAKSFVGLDLVEYDVKGGVLQKKDARVHLDFSGLAKGYGVDRIGELLKEHGFTDFLVEIGGELIASGHKKSHQTWRTGIFQPSPDNWDKVMAVIDLKDRALATSGTYRQFFEIDGVKYTHIIDPKTGWPVPYGVVSVSVLAPTCAMADGLATGLLVDGPEVALDIVNNLPDVEVMIVEDLGSQGYKISRSSGWPE